MSNEITFSKKFIPLFKLLKAKEVVESSGFSDLPEDEKKEWLELSNVDTVLISGGRDSGKSFGLSSWNVIAARDYGHSVLYTRQTMSSTTNSIVEALENRIELFGVADSFEKKGSNFVVQKNGVDYGKVSITGQETNNNRHSAKLKSLEGYSIFQTDEGEELESYEEFKKVKRSLRRKDVQCLAIISFNPPTREHWLFDEFYEEFYDSLTSPEEINGIRGNVMYIHGSYLDNVANMADHNILEYDNLKKDYDYYESLTNEERESVSSKIKRNWKEYKYAILGGFRDVAEGVIYENWEIGEFPEGLSYIFGIDFGFDDPDVLAKVYVDESQKKIYIKEELYTNGLSTDALASILLDRCGHENLIIGDSAHRRLINDLYEKGLNINGVQKRGTKVDGFKKRLIKTMQGYTLIIDPSSKNGIKALKNYAWHDKKAGVPINTWKHFPDAFGYAAIEVIEY